jgi:hypothetical protein
LTFDNKWENTINSDGIALDTKMTYSTFMLTGYSLYSVPTKVLANATAEVEKSVKLVAKTAALME